MGPSAFTDGNSYSASIGGAQSALQWGRRRSPTEMARGPADALSRHGFNGAVGVHRRKSCAARPLRASGVCFNGAVGVHRRKCRERSRVLIRAHASMGPSAFTDGNIPRGSPRVTSARLQWGRRRSPTEMPCPSPSSAPWAALQWGRRRSPTEMPQGSRRVASRASFNGAVGVHRRKFKQEGCAKAADMLASMGPSAFTDGNRRRSVADIPRHPASMGPSAFTDGNTKPPA